MASISSFLLYIYIAVGLFVRERTEVIILIVMSYIEKVVTDSSEG